MSTYQCVFVLCYSLDSSDNELEADSEPSHKNITSSRPPSPHHKPPEPLHPLLLVSWVLIQHPEEKLVLDGGEKGLQLTCQRTVKWAFGMTSAWRMRLQCYPKRNPGAQLVMDRKYPPLQLFQLFFPYSMGNTIAKNTNSYAKMRTDAGKKVYVLHNNTV